MRRLRDSMEKALDGVLLQYLLNGTPTDWELLRSLASTDATRLIGLSRLTRLPAGRVTSDAQHGAAVRSGAVLGFVRVCVVVLDAAPPARRPVRVCS